MRIIQNLVLFFLISSFFLVVLYFLPRLSFQKEGPTQVFFVHSGENYPQVAKRLEKRGIIRSERMMRWYVKWRSFLERKQIALFRGEYAIHSGMSLVEVLELLERGKTVVHKFTIPEGSNMFQIAQELKRRSIGKEKAFLHLVKNKDFIRRLSLPTVSKKQPSSLEGYLYPDTYFLEKNMNEKELIKRMVDRFKEVYASFKEDLDKSSIWKEMKLNEHELITLASIVEKETGAGFERPLIAGVFYNRLKKRMRLESDPTIIYGMWERDGDFKGNIRRKDLRTHTPYNTYVVGGLPKGPIANPGVNALRAVLYPKDSDYLFFVSRNDGTHVFSTNYRDHEKAVNVLQKRARSRKGKSWRDLPEKLRARNK